nr:MAG TPA: hypothetical protein [Caudoviricetes sp.]
MYAPILSGFFIAIFLPTFKKIQTENCGFQKHLKVIKSNKFS